MKNVLELKTKKMSLANIDGKLTPGEMENIMAGSGGRNCFFIGLGLFVCVVGAGAGGGWGMVAGGGAIGGYFTAASASCF